MPAFLGKRKHHRLFHGQHEYIAPARNKFRECIKVAKQNMLTPEAHLNSVCTKFKTSAQVRTLFSPSHSHLHQAGKNCLFEIHPVTAPSAPACVYPYTFIRTWWCEI
jgi:hypothetical protein